MSKQTHQIDETLSRNKGQLAKLMATENISVHHRNVQTAYFDTKNRVLVCPIWKDMDGDVYDLLMGHEISHALHTPKDGWHDTIVLDPKRKNIKRFLNVIEDARIEKLIKHKYPGLRKPFADAYQTLHERDLFKIRKLKGDYSKLNLIDRINLYFKFGVQVMVKFDAQEQVFVDRTAAAETWDEVVQIARDVYDYCRFKEPKKDKQQAKDKPKQKPEEQDAGDDEESDDSEGDVDTSDDLDGDADQDEADGDSDSDEADTESDETGDKDDQEETEESDASADAESDEASDEDEAEGEIEDGDGAGSADDSDEEDDQDAPEPDSATDEAFRKAESDLINERGCAQVYLDLPKPHLKSIIIPNDTVVKAFEHAAEYELKGSYSNLPLSIIQSKLAVAFNARNKTFISLMVKEFEMKKNASQYARQLTSRTGILDDVKLSRYKFTNDIFRKVTTVQKGKSHGLVLFLDMSGSMIGQWKPIVEQLLLLVAFCKRINLPFDVYGFGDKFNYTRNGAPFSYSRKSFKMSSRAFCLRHLLSSELAPSAFKRAFNMMLFAQEAPSYSQRDPEIQPFFPSATWASGLDKLTFKLGGTPYIQTLVASRDIIDLFKQNHKVDVTNVIYLTDGYGDQTCNLSDEWYEMNRGGTTDNRIDVGFQDPKTRMRVMSDMSKAVPYQAAITKLVAQVTGCRHIGYYFGDHQEVRYKACQHLNTKEAEVVTATILDKGFVALPNIGYDNYYYVNNEALRYKGTMLINSKMSRDEMHGEFNRHAKMKQTTKLVVKQFAGEIAE